MEIEYFKEIVKASKEVEKAEDFLCAHCGHDMGTYVPMCCPMCTSSEYIQYKKYHRDQISFITD